MFLLVTSQTYLTTSPVVPDALSDDEKVFIDRNSILEILEYEDQGEFWKLRLKYPIKNTYTWFVRRFVRRIDFVLANNDTNPELYSLLGTVVSRNGFFGLNMMAGMAGNVLWFRGGSYKEQAVEESKFEIGSDEDYIAEFNVEKTRDSGTIIDDLNYSITSQSSSFLLRYPNLDCPDKVLLNQRFSLIVELLIEQPEEQPEVKALMIEDKQADLPPEIEVVLSASGFDLEGSNTQIIQIERDDDSSVRFVLVPSKLGQHKIKVQFYQNGKPIGKAVRNILVSEQPVTTEVPQPYQPTELELNNGKIPPQDLELFIELDEDDHTLSFFLHSVKEEIGYRRTKVGKVILKGSPLEKMQSIYEKMNQYANTKPTKKEGEILAEKRIADVGNDLWEELIPHKLKQEYWKFKNRVKSIMINSDEPWIPWEMLKPFRDNDED